MLLGINAICWLAYLYLILLIAPILDTLGFIVTVLLPFQLLTSQVEPHFTQPGTPVPA